ncbi:MAG: hypothetical protein RBG1_1C00001G0067 [candidate division Zixibacteria bacterium RBG-1]|nr:MAG: hypothetical protein RBG1_1C00001G0067 [candidate division Zixibacteria bacterium RBG-1]
MKKAYLATLIGFLFFSFAWAQEHPEHPKQQPKTTKQEHPQKETASLTTADLAKGISDYVDEDSKLKGGYLLIYDPSIKKSLELTLTKVHQDKLSQVGENLYFACSDFKATNDKMYDLDFFMKQDENGLMVTEISIHKEEGKPRYSWAEEKGLWVRKPTSK